MIIDLDSHLREEYFLDEVYQLEGPYAQFTPVRVGNGRDQEAVFVHHLSPTSAKVNTVFNSMPPSEYVRRNCYVTCEADEKLQPLAIAEPGEDHVCLATDYPHFDSVYPNTVSRIMARSDITSRQKAKMLGGNAARLLNL